MKEELDIMEKKQLVIVNQRDHLNTQCREGQNENTKLQEIIQDKDEKIE